MLLHCVIRLFSWHTVYAFKVLLVVKGTFTLQKIDRYLFYTFKLYQEIGEIYQVRCVFVVQTLEWTNLVYISIHQIYLPGGFELATVLQLTYS